MSSLTQLVISLILLFAGTNAAKYTVVPDDEQIFKPCEGEEDHFLTTMFDISNLRFDFVSDDEVIVDGYFKSIAPIGHNDTLWAFVEIIKEVRGQYILPAVEIKRDNVCKAAFNPVEVWYSYSSKLDKKYQICPNVEGTVYKLSNWSAKTSDVNLPDSKLSGGYRCIIRGGVKDKPDMDICMLFDFHLFLQKL